MTIFKNLTIIGTSHIATESIKEVETQILNLKPEVIALELDLLRFQKLTSKQQKKIHFSFRKGFLLNLIGAWIEKKLGEKVGTIPGEEMKTAINLAKKENIKISLIDQDIRITLQKLSKEFTFKEKLRFLKDILLGILSKQKIKIDLTKVPDKKLIKKVITNIKKRYPSIYKVLVEERNEIMAKKLITLMQQYKTVLAIVGAGHVDDLIEKIKCLSQKKS